MFGLLSLYVRQWANWWMDGWMGDYWKGEGSVVVIQSVERLAQLGVLG